MDRSRADRGRDRQASDARPDPGGIFITVIIGIVGAVIGGFIGNSLGVGDVTGVNLWSIVLSVVGAIVLLIVYRMVTGRRASA